MTGMLEERAPRVRCYRCGSDNIFSVCHHVTCVRPMCEEHSPAAFREGGQRVKAPSGASEESARPLSHELTRMKLGRAREEAVFHCEDHEHVVGGGASAMVVLGVILAVLGIIILLFNTVFGVIVLLAGAAVAGIAFLAGRAKAATASADPPPFPVIPHVNSTAVTERLSGVIRLEDGVYSSKPGEVTGEVTLDMSASDASNRLKQYREKFRPQEGRPVKFIGGFALFEGSAGIHVLPGQPAVLPSGAGVLLGGEFAGADGIVPPAHGRAGGDWNVGVGYTLQESRKPEEIPLWIVPSLVPASARRALEIDLHWNTLGKEESELEILQFDKIELEVPASWGNVQSILPGRAEISPSGDRRVITWKKVKPGEGKGAVKGGKTLTLAIRFERPITEAAEPAEPAGDLDGVAAPGSVAEQEAQKKLTLSGTLEATFGGTLSGLSGVRVYLPGGGAGHRVECKAQTTVTVKFDVGLRTLRYQEDRVIPDENSADDRRKARNEPIERQGVVPDARTVTELTNAISADNFYVKSIIEHPPFRDDGRANVVNRVWDITGRRYDGVFPIDFDINLRGDEVGQAGASALSGKTLAQVTVKGAHTTGTEPENANAAAADEASTEDEAAAQLDNELLELIEDTWNRLHAKVTDVLAARAAYAAGSKALAAPPEDIADGEFVEDDIAAPAAADDDVVEAEAVVRPAAGTLRPYDEDISLRVAALRKQRQEADDAVVKGVISEEVYRVIVTRIEAEYIELKGSS
jgi:hypothetical protein